jgi:hypothetical protein
LRLLPTILFCSLAQCAPPQGAAPEDALLGLWGVEQILGPLVHGELTIDARGAQWLASIAGYVVVAEHTGNEIKFVLPRKAGELRAHLSADHDAIVGHWIQPANSVFNNRYASPVELRKMGESVWRGHVLPLNQQISFYVSVQRAAGGAVTAFIRNPEFNFFRRGIFQVRLEGKVVTFSQNGDEHQGSYDAESDTLTLPLLDSAPPLQLTRRRDFDAVGFYPRVARRSTSYAYYQPVAAGDGWLTASLAESCWTPSHLHSSWRKF